MEAFEPLLTGKELAASLRISMPTFWRRVADGTIPKPIKMGSLSRWTPADQRQVIEKARAGRAS